MSLLALAAAALLTLTDPTGDAAGDGTLEPPTSPVYANAALFDLQEVSVVAGASQADPATLRVAMGAVELDESQPAGFNRSVVDVYLDLAEGGATATLQGPGMLMPPGKGWEYAVRISPRGAFGAPAPFEEGQSVEWSPLDLAIDGDVLVVGLPDGIGPDLDVFALSGVFDAFSPHSWRPLAAAPSPWSYSGTEQVVPVIDLIAADHETQMTALREGVLPAPARRAAGGLTWLLLSMAGVLIAATGLWLRRVAGAAAPARPASAREEPVEGEAPETTAEAEEVVDEPLAPEVEAESLAAEPETASEEFETAPDGAETDPEEPETALDGVETDPEEPETAPAEAASAPDEEEAAAIDAEAAVGVAETDPEVPEPRPVAESSGEPADAPTADDRRDRFERLRRDLEGSEEPEDDMLGFSDDPDRRARHLTVEHTDDEGDPAGS